MYSSAIDEHEAVAIWDLSGEMTDDAEWDRHFADMRRICTWTATTGKRPAVLLLISSGWSRPDAKRRAQLAEASAVAGYDPYLAIVTSNTIVRGVLTVLNWLQEKPRYEVTVLPDTDQGLAWLEKKRGESLPSLRRLVAANRAGAGKR
jgi:hypothetical protein